MPLAILQQLCHQLPVPPLLQHLPVQLQQQLLQLPFHPQPAFAALIADLMTSFAAIDLFNSSVNTSSSVGGEPFCCSSAAFTCIPMYAGVVSMAKLGVDNDASCIITHACPPCLLQQEFKHPCLAGREEGLGGGGGGAGCVIVHQLFRRCVEIQTSGNVPTTYVTVKAKALDLVN